MAKKDRDGKIANSPFADKFKNFDKSKLAEGTPHIPPQRREEQPIQQKEPLPEKRSRTLDWAVKPPANLPRYTQAQYDKWLVEVLTQAHLQGTHNLNPFDFVLITHDQPSLFDIEGIEKGQELYTGYMEVDLKALTPIHVVGKQTPAASMAGRKIGFSYFYKEAGECCIPGSSIKGMLRSFIEAMTNGWVSQAQENLKDDTPTYEKINGNLDRVKGRHLGFDSFKVTENTHRNGNKSEIQPGIPPTYRPDSSRGFDIASYLFGIVADKDTKGQSWKHKVAIGDALVSPNAMKKDCPMLDLEATAFMGGPHPSASNWWYVMPSRIQERRGQKPTGGPYGVYEMVGEGFWGRKFYYHQKPEDCIAFYQDHTRWPPDRRRPIYSYQTECLEENQKAYFRIDFRRLPKAMLDLLCFALVPGENIRHKLGYGGQYGYGSLELKINKILARKETDPLNLDNPVDWELKDDIYHQPAWKERCNLRIGEKSLIDEEALLKLTRILTWDPLAKIVFTYPPNRGGDFQTFIPIKPLEISVGPIGGSPAIKAAAGLWNRVPKRPIHFLLYQACAKDYASICKREP